MLFLRDSRVKGALGVAAVGAAVAAGTRRKHRAALAGDIEAIRAIRSQPASLSQQPQTVKPFSLLPGAATVTKLSQTRSLADAKVVVCAGAMLPEAQLQPVSMKYKSVSLKA